MDAQALEITFIIPGLPRIRTSRRPAARPAPTSPDPGPGPAAVTSTRTRLHVYTAASIAAGLGALAWTTLQVPIRPAIDTGLTGTALGGPDGGLLLWIALGFIGSLRVLPIPGSSGVWTFHFPFIAAAMVLGGPTAGAWVGLLSSLERRELESQPWYGALANHAVLAFAAVVGGLAVEVTRGALSILGTDVGVAGLVATLVGTLVLAMITSGLAAGTIMLRDGLSASAMLSIVIRSLGRITVAEIGLAWVFVVAYAAVGWWAPLVAAIGVVLVWPSRIYTIDDLTGLMRLPEFQQALNAAFGWARIGARTGGVLMMIDLDRFGQINKNPKLGFDIGNEVLAEIGKRIRAEMRRQGDIAARLGGDEFAAFVQGTFDAAAAVRIAQRIERAIRRPVLTSAGVIEVGASIGVVIVPRWGEAPDVAALMKSGDSTMQRQKADGGGVALVEPRGSGTTAGR
jgi:diguanylate cyclase (GGDEF)-like protein